MQEVFEQPSTKHGDGSLWEPTLRPPDVVRLAERSHAACSLEGGGTAAGEPEHGDVLAESLFAGSSLGRIPQLAQYHALEALEMLRHGPQRHGRERSGVAEPCDRLERVDHSLDLLVVQSVPLANLREKRTL